jgi:hypothetical protein
MAEEDPEVHRIKAASRKKEWTPENLPSKLDDWDAPRPRVVERIKAESERWTPLLRSLVAARAILSRIVDRLSPQDAMGARWYLEGLTPGNAARTLVAHGVLSSEPPAASLEAIEARWRKDHRPFVLLQDLFHEAGILTLLNREYWTVPIDYDDVIQGLSRGSAGVFRPDAVTQAYREARAPGDGGYSIEFLYEAKVHAFDARDGGDWIDVQSLLAGLNGALATAGRKERFLAILSSDQIAIIVFADETGLRCAAEELWLPLAP